MNVKKTILRLVRKMPESVTLGQAAHWLNTVDMLGCGSAKQKAALEDLSTQLDKEMDAYFSKEQVRSNGSAAGKETGDKAKLLNLIEHMPDDIDMAGVRYRLGLLRAMERALEQIERGEGVEHDELFDRLMKKYEASQNNLVSRRRVGSARHRATHRSQRSKNGSKVHKPAKKVRG